MKFEDESQNLRLRLRVIQVVVLALLAVLGVRLYFLQVANGAYYAERAENQRVRLLPIPAQRGTIFDRQGQVLACSRTCSVTSARSVRSSSNSRSTRTRA